MEYIKEINIMEAIIHVLDNNGDEPLLNDYQLELNEETYTFLLKNVEKCLKDEKLRYAKFNPGRSIVKEVAEEYFNGRDNLTNISKELSIRLFDFMRANRDIPSCDLCVLSIVTEYGPMIAILKMDYVKNFAHKIDIIENKIGINIINGFGLSTSKQKIEKAAFIKPTREGQKFNVMVLDKVKRQIDKDEYGSNYFTDNYLNCSLIMNERDNTKNFLAKSEYWIRNNIVDDAEKQESIRDNIKNALLNNEKIEIDSFSNNLDEDMKLNYRMFMEQFIEPDFEVDKVYAEKKLNRIRLKIDKDIDLYISDESYRDKNKFEIVKNGDGSINMTLKYINNYIEK